MNAGHSRTPARGTQRRPGSRPLLGMMLVLIPLLSACRSEPPPLQAHLGDFVRYPTPPLDSLSAAPETIRVGYTWMVADAELWLNLMPGDVSGPEPEALSTTPLDGLVYLRRADSLPVQPAAGVALQGAWLRAGDRTWALASAQNAPGMDGIPPLTHSVAGGPAWLGRDDTVDVILRVRSLDGSSRLVQKRRVHLSIAE